MECVSSSRNFSFTRGLSPPYLQIMKFTRCRIIGPLTYLSPLPDQSPHTPTISKYPPNYLFNSAIVTGTNEVAWWAHHPYITPFPNFRTLLQELRASIFRSVLIHMILILPSTHSHSLGYHRYLVPQEHFSHATFRYACSLSVLITYMSYILFIYCSRRVFGFHVFSYLFKKLTTPSGLC
jgi:hypothetical protein